MSLGRNPFIHAIFYVRHLLKHVVVKHPQAHQRLNGFFPLNFFFWYTVLAFCRACCSAI